MTTLDELIDLARVSHGLTAKDEVSGVVVVIRRGPHGLRVECYMGGERRHYNVCKRAMEGAL